jgi:hypothetical protein
MIGYLFRLGLLAIFCACHTQSNASARSTYDGQWSVLIVTQRGSCDRAYRYGVHLERNSYRWWRHRHAFRPGCSERQRSRRRIFRQQPGQRLRTPLWRRRPRELERPVRRRHLFRLLDSRTAQLDIMQSNSKRPERYPLRKLPKKPSAALELMVRERPS